MCLHLHLKINQSMPTKDNSQIFIPLAFLTVYVVWGSTYMFIAYAVEEIPPFLLSGIRYTVAAMLLFGLVFFSKGWKNITKRQFRNAVIAGVFLLGVSAVSVSWSLKRLDSGFTALLISTQPLVTVLMMWAVNKVRPEKSSFFGVFLGLIGAYLLVSQNGIIASADQWLAILWIYGSIFVWAYITIFINKADMPKDFMANTSIQLLSGGIIALLLSFIAGEETVVWSEVSQMGWIALAVVIVFGAALVFVAFNYLLKKSTPDKVATTTYINPVIALFLGWFFRDELVTTQSIIAAAIMLTGVVFINFKWETIKGFFQKKRS